MSLEFDLNINNYSISELEKFLGLKEKYSFNDILNNEKEFIDVLNSTNDYDKRKKNEIIDFLSIAKEKMFNKLKNIVDIQNNGFIEDYEKLLDPTTEKNIINQTTADFGGYHYVMNKNTTSFNEVIDKEQKLNPVETYPTNIARSYLNNLKRKTINQTIILNSLYREDYLSSLSTDFNITLPNHFKNVLSIRLSSLQLPNVIYCISNNNNNNSLYISEDILGGVKGIVILPDGNYDYITFATLLQTEINTQLITSNFVVTTDSATQKITITNNINTFTMNFIVKEFVSGVSSEYIINKNYKQLHCINDITELYKKLGWLMGYRKSLYKGEKSYTSEGIYNGTFTEYIYFILNDFNNSQSQNIIGMFSKSTIGNNILAMIPLNANSFHICFDNGADFIEKKREYFGPVNIQKLKIQLLNQYGEILNLNSMDFSFSLELELAYDI
jgi:hypothetical protein